MIPGDPREYGGTLPDGRRWIHPPYGPRRIERPSPFLASTATCSRSPEAAPVASIVGITLAEAADAIAAAFGGRQPGCWCGEPGWPTIPGEYLCEAGHDFSEASGSRVDR